MREPLISLLSRAVQEEKSPLLNIATACLRLSWAAAGLAETQGSAAAKRQRRFHILTFWLLVNDLLLLVGFDFQGNCYIVTNDGAAVIHGFVVGDVEVFALNFCGGASGNFCIAPGIFYFL